MKKLLFTVVVASMLSCATKQNTSSAATADTTEWSQESVMANGTVTALQYGKDGYTATIKTDDNILYLATISHANLKDPSQYRSVKVADRLHVSGEGWGTVGEKHIIVRAIM